MTPAVKAPEAFGRLFTSIFSNHIRDRKGRVLRDHFFRPNLRTNAGIDWQAGAMGDFTEEGNTATGATATTLTRSGASWTTNAWTGHVVVALVDVNTIRFGVILSNTATALTIDKWYDPTAVTGAAGSTPSATSKYVILPGGVPHWFMALTTDAAAPGATDTTLASELSTNGFARAMPTSYSHSAGVASYSIVKTFTCSGGAGTTINKEAVFNAQNGGLMAFESAEPSPPTLLSGDTLQQTVTVSI